MTAEAATLRAGPATLHAGGSYGDLRLSGFDIAIGQPYGAMAAPPLPEPAGEPLEVLEEVVRGALLRPPCVIAFSGGRDSSALLAVAAHVAWRDGLEPPVAATHRFPEVAESHERDWQELVIAHLGIADWELLHCGDELDVVGPVATTALRRHGPLSPPNAHFMVPLATLAQGGTLLTGLDGDLVLGGWRWSRLGVLARGAARPRPRDLVTAVHCASPLGVQRRVAERLGEVEFPWLAPDAAREVNALRAREGVAHPRRFDRFLDWARRRRHLVMVRRQLDLLGKDAGALIEHPLVDDRFLAAYAAAGGAFGFGGRTDTMRALVGHLLPEALVVRPTKATFSGVFMGDRAREFAASWEGGGLDPDLVDAEALRADWAGPAISFRSTALLQWLWLRAEGTA
jgi:hypothetical protein